MTTTTATSWLDSAQNVLSATKEIKIEGEGRTRREKIGWTPTRFLWTYSLALSADKSQVRGLRYTYSENTSQKEVFDCGALTALASPQAATAPRTTGPETVDQRIQRELEEGRIRLRTLYTTSYQSASAGTSFRNQDSDVVKVHTTDGWILVRPGETKFIEVARTPENRDGRAIPWINGIGLLGTKETLSFRMLPNDPSGKPVLLMVARDRVYGSTWWSILQAENSR